MIRHPPISSRTDTLFPYPTRSRPVLAEIAGRHHRTALGADVSADVGDDVVDVDGMGDGLAHAQIVQRLDRLVQVDGAELAGLEDVDDRLFVLPRILNPALLALAVDEVQLAGGESQIAAGVGDRKSTRLNSSH